MHENGFSFFRVDEMTNVTPTEQRVHLDDELGLDSLLSQQISIH